AELARGAGVSLEDAAARSDQALADLIELWNVMGDRPFAWYIARTTSEALVRNSYAHPRYHIAEHFIERGDPERGYQLYEETAAELRRVGAPGHTLGTAVYNLARARAGQGRRHDALRLLDEAIPMRDDIRTLAPARMQAMARHTNHSETPFVRPAPSAENAARVPIFTPHVELPFAGHTTIATSWVLLNEGIGAEDAGSFALEEGVGPVAVRFD